MKRFVHRWNKKFVLNIDAFILCSFFVDFFFYFFFFILFLLIFRSRMPKREEKARIPLTFLAGTQIPNAFEGVPVTLTWKRGSKPANRGSSKKMVASKNRLSMSDQARFPVVTL